MRIIRIYINSFSGLSKEAWMLAVVMLINRSGSMVLPFLGVYMTEQLNFSIKESGIVLSFFGIGAVIGSWLGGWLTDRFGEFKVQVISLFLSAPVFAIIPLCKTVTAAAVLILLQSIITESFRPANSVAITKYAKPENLTRAFSLNRMAINLGFTIGPAMGGILAAISYNFLFAVNTIAVIAAGIVYFRFFRGRKSPSRNTEKKPVAPAAGRAIVRERSVYADMPFIIYCLLCGVFSVCFFQFFNTLPLFYKDVAMMSPKAIGFILGFSGFIVVVLEMLLVSFAERYFTPAFTILLGGIGVAIAYSMLAVNHHWTFLYLSVTLLSIGEILLLPFMSAITAARSGRYNKGAYMGLNGMAVSASFIVTPYLGTRIAANEGFDTLWIGTGVAVIIISVALYGIIDKMMRGKTLRH